MVNVDFSETSVVAVSGDGPNVCGHLLLYADSRGGFYFQVAGLKESGKVELIRRPVDIPDPNGALLKLEELMSKSWTWWVLPHNCVAFCEDMITAGGRTWGSYSNCPAIATDAYLQNAYDWLVNGIYGIYGVPR
ncbi:MULTISPECIES: hypothetical protein [unclassified Paraburkholderia]|uniref:hypothetical protein n=1 Tax=unclassified Paraburkholderia TaxID=2615204 RepID=UPI00161AECA6|nr:MULTISPECIES: hypothetical protein [unclassified Paraburkholderia]MBB5444783.1 hypothetical protein [Paraburkholderia sp. WSM4177]MBB5483715.1 hypothetical protein [Paraburkholderia sp. WSM4180]